MEKKSLSADDVQEVLNKIEAYLEDLKKRWDAENPDGNTWWKVHRLRLVKGTGFIINSLDRLIQFVEELIPEGKDKKATVMTIVAQLFDYIVVQAFPLWLKPFAPTIKRIIVEVLVASAIDFIVAKYNEGVWKMNTQNA